MTDRVTAWVAEFIAWRDRVPAESERVIEGVRAMKLHKPTRALLTCDGAIFPLDHPVSMNALREAIGASAIDVVSMTDGVHVMCVDDTGAKKHLPFNERATQFYFQKCGGVVPWRIHGDAVIVPDVDFAPSHMREFKE